MGYKEYVCDILHKEISSIIERQGYVLETEFCTMLCDKYKMTMPTARGTLSRMYPQMELLKRRLSDELKRFYGIEVKGYPIVYLPTSQCRIPESMKR